jgi:hypothetical protein
MSMLGSVRDMNVITLTLGPGIILELRTRDPVPASGYRHLAELARVGEDLAALPPETSP